ncbi:cell surface protein [Myroides odoratimimus]|uniref:cell surface protein n=1 Tax=Myroides odoratimimus TaxID=76832 RepID=UPI001CE22F32|nr:cell surface protein [Myroides odoratimimus]MCA4794021.1 cell surface protein [Myroides odoratimimus]MCA4821281.1 cell surface protein [Myroides odoratimimus]
MKTKRLKLSLIATLCLSAITFYSCSSDDSSPGTPPIDPVVPTGNVLKLDSIYQVDRSKLVLIKPELKQFTNPSISWKVIKLNDISKDSIISDQQQLDFVTLNTGNYTIEIEAKDPKLKINQQFNIIVNKESVEYKKHITKVFDFMPSYGQFTNKLPVYNVGDTKETMIKKAQDAIAKDKAGMISLGGFGGYVVFGFDHTIVNVPGKRDFRVLGNAFWASGNPNPEAPGRGGSCEPGIIMVAYDKNQNGIPDEDEWYEIAGSEYHKKETIKNYEITYYKPDPNKEPVKDPSNNWATDLEYIKWEDNQGNKGWKPKNTFHQQSYFPEWHTGDKITFKGTKLANNAKDESGQGSYWVLYSYPWGYADNAPNNDDESAIDINWAVDKDGNKVNLPGIDFVKVYTGINQESGWLGEVSTEVAGAIDLHVEGTSINTRK